MTLLYIAGPMTGIPDWNRPAFTAAADQLRGAGYRVINPAASRALPDDAPWAQWLRLGLRQVLDVDGVALLPGWETSRGASLECRVATELGLPVSFVDDWVARVVGDAS